MQKSRDTAANGKGGGRVPLVDARGKKMVQIVVYTRYVHMTTGGALSSYSAFMYEFL